MLQFLPLRLAPEFSAHGLMVGCIALLLAGALPSHAQNAPPPVAPETAPATGTQGIIEALKPRTRAYLPGGGRNIVVREDPVPAAAAASAPPAVPPTSPTSALFNPIQPPALTPVSPGGSEPAAPASYSMAVQFDYASAHIRADSQQALGQLADALKSPELVGSRFRIEGHTDASGSPADNLKLSQRRAEEVRRFLLARGVGAERVMALGMGAKEPANPADPLAAENRRVRIVTLE